MNIIDNSGYTKNKKEHLKKVIEAVAKKHGIAKVLEQVENGKITDLRKLKTVKGYLKEIEKLGINPVTISARMNEDSPELTPAMEKAFRLAAKNRNTQRNMSVS